MLVDRAVPAIAIIGNPNTGKTTLFNALTGLAHKVGNYPGVTVERRAGVLKLTSGRVEVIDLPGTYSLAARSLDEAIAVDTLLGRQSQERSLDAVIAVIDAANLDRNLYLLSQLMDFSVPVVVALNMMDAAQRRGIQIDVQRLSQRLGVPVVPMRADRGEGVDQLRDAIARTLNQGRADAPARALPLPEGLNGPIEKLLAQFGDCITPPLQRPELLRALVDTGGAVEQRLDSQLGTPFGDALRVARSESRLFGVPAAQEAEARHRWARELAAECVTRPTNPPTAPSERIDSLLTHRVYGTLVLVLALGLVFQAIYKWSTPVMDGIESLFGWLGQWVATTLPDGPLQSLIVNGIIGGTGGVIVFLPQILLLFFFLGILEDCGYMARAAFLMDKVLARAGLSGKAVIPLLSSFACAVPGIMSARVVEDRRDRIATILIAPLMSCSARLPVYVLLIGAFIPARQTMGGWIGVQGLALFAAHLIGVLVALPVLWIVKKTLLKGPTPPFVMELPAYQWPNGRSVADRLLTRGRAFLKRAGTVIVSVAILVWALSYFPHPAEIRVKYDALRAAVSSDAERAQLDHAEAAEYLSQSLFARIGHAIEPAVTPLGWDWRIGMAVAASFPAREVVIATMGTIFGVGADVDESSRDLESSLQAAKRSDGSPLFSIPVALSLVVFFALCCQCAATLVVMRRETGTWRWPLFAFSYMTGLAWIGAWITYHAAIALGGS